MAVTVKFHGLRSAMERLQGTRSSIKNMSIQDFGNAVAERAKENLRGSIIGWPQTTENKKGTLEKSIIAQELNRGRVIISASAKKLGFDYAGVQEFGGPERFAKRAGAMKFSPLTGRKPIYAKHVKGFAGKHYMLNAAKWGEARFKRYLVNKVNRIIKSKGKEGAISVGIYRG